MKYAIHWKKLGRNLEIDHNLLNIIEKNNPLDCERCCSKMLSEWLDLTPNASWEMLSDAMDKIKDEVSEGPDVAEKFSTAVDDLSNAVEKLRTAADALPDTIDKLGTTADIHPD